jgi:hypothetical protein
LTDRKTVSLCRAAQQRNLRGIAGKQLAACKYRERKIVGHGTRYPAAGRQVSASAGLVSAVRDSSTQDMNRAPRWLCAGIFSVIV